MAAIKTFKDLQVWQKAHKTVLEIYKITSLFPKYEIYGLTAQLRRAIISVASNIVEGFKRHSVHDSVHFYNIADASLEEVKYQLLVAHDLGYINKQNFSAIINLVEEVSKMLRSWTQSQLANAGK